MRLFHLHEREELRCGLPECGHTFQHFKVSWLGIRIEFLANPDPALQDCGLTFQLGKKLPYE